VCKDYAKKQREAKRRSAILALYGERERSDYPDTEKNLEKHRQPH